MKPEKEDNWEISIKEKPVCDVRRTSEELSWCAATLSMLVNSC